MNVLLTTSAPPPQTPFSTTEKRPPIGVGFLISVLRDAGHKVFFIDNYLSPSNFLETDYLQRHQIDFVGIYTNTICYRDSLRMFYRLEELRQIGDWKGKIIAGGPHASVSPETIPAFVDHIVVGEGEYALRDIVEGKVNERIVRYPAIEDLDELPMPAWDYFADMPYNWGGNWLPEAPVFTMNTSRGCPFDCTFCSVGSIWGRRYTYFSAERVVADIEYVVKHHGAKGIYFREDNFTLNKQRLYEFCNLIIEREIHIPWVCETRASSLDRETVELMARAGAKGAYIGVESGSQRLLDFMHKAIKLEDVRRAFKLCKEFGINTAASIIVGVPTETQQDLQMTKALLKEINPTVTWFNVFVGIPDSNLYRYVLNNKLYEYIDDRGLVYLKGHNERVQTWYGKAWDAGVPVQIHNHTIINPKVSVIMSVYNGDKYLLDSIKSIQTQTFNNFEFLIVNDASNDNTAEILRNLDDPRIMVFTNQQNIGLTRSLNKVLKHCRGEFIARMDADDLSHPLRLEKQVAFLENNPTYAMVGSSYYVIDEQGKTKSHVKVLTESSQIKAGLKNQNWFGHGSVMMRKSALIMVGRYDEEFKYAQDYDLWLRLSEIYDMANMQEPLYFWRNTEQTISSQKFHEQQHFAALAKAKALIRAQQCTENSRQQDITPAESPRVSVIVPTYNRPDMLPDTLQSILAQTYPNIEIIVVNDAGENVEPLVKSIAPNAVYIYHEKNKGLAGTRNTGIRHARGKYIAYLDDDDLFYPEHVETLVSFLESSNYKVAYTDANRAHQIKKGNHYFVEKRDRPYSFDFDYDKILVANFIPVLCVMHEKSCFDTVGAFDESLKRHEDWELWLRMSRKFRFAHIPQVTCEFSWRTDGNGMTASTKPMFLTTMATVYEKHKELTTPHLDRRKRAQVWSFMHSLYSFLGEQITPLIPLFTSDKTSEGRKKLFALSATGASNKQLESCLAYLLALHSAENGNITEAIDHLEQAIATDGANPLASEDLALLYRKIGKSTDAARIYRHIISRNESAIRALLALAEIAKEAGDLNEARESFQKVLSINPNNDVAVEGLKSLPDPSIKSSESSSIKALTRRNAPLILPTLLDEIGAIPLLVPSINRPVIIGIATSHGRETDLSPIEDALERISIKYGTGVAFRFYGSGTARLKKLSNSTFTPLTDNYLEYVSTLGNLGIDIGLAFEDGELTNQFGNNFKWVEYSALGIAGIYADIPTYRTSIENGKTGLLVERYDVDAWVAALEDLIDTPDRRHSIALSARTQVLASYTQKSPYHPFPDSWCQLAGGSTTAFISSPPFVASRNNNEMQVSIVIPLQDGLEYTKQCLEALAHNTDESINYEVILVDNTSSDGIADYLRHLSGDVTIVTNFKIQGNSRAYNQGGRIAQGRYLVFLKNDTIPNPGWLDGLLNGVTQDGADIVGAKLLYPNGRVNHAGIAFNEESIGYHIHNGLPGNAPTVNRKRFMQCVSAACMLVKREIFEELGGFDESYTNSFGDLDFCLRAGERGYRVLYTPESMLIRLNNVSKGLHDDNQLCLSRFIANWKGKIRQDDSDFHYAECLDTEVTTESQFTTYPFNTALESTANIPYSPIPTEVSSTPDAVIQPYERDMATQLKQEGRFQEALVAFSQLRDKGDHLALSEMGDCLANLGELNSAIASYREALRENKNNIKATIGLGVVNFLQGKMTKAVTLFNKTLKVEPNNTHALCGLGMVRDMQGKHKEAFDFFSQALAADPEHMISLNALVKLAYLTENFDEALTRLDSYLMYHPADLDILYTKAGILFKAERYSEALESLEIVLLFAPEYDGGKQLSELIKERLAA